MLKKALSAAQALKKPKIGLAGIAASAFLACRSTGAFRTPESREKRFVSLQAFENELGVQAPVGFFDPCGMSKDGDMTTFMRRRETEIKHGRVAMWAAMGYIVPEYFRWPGYCSTSEKLAFTDIPNGLAALGKVPAAGWCQMFLFAGLLEKVFFVYDPSRAPGDFVNGGVLGIPNGSSMPEGEGKTRKLNSEIANGRLAMMAIIGMFFQDGLTGSAWGDWGLYADSPLRAFENELGVQPPLGYWLGNLRNHFADFHGHPLVPVPFRRDAAI